MNNEIILSAGIDIGTTTTHLILSKIEISLTGGFGVVPKTQIVSKQIIYKSPIYLTPLKSNGLIDGNAVAKIIEQEYKLAGVCKSQLKSGAVIVTGESSKKDNAAEVLQNIADLAGNFVAAQAGSELESYLSGKGATADVISENTGKIVANVDIGGGTTNISVFKNGDCVDTCCLEIGGRLLKQCKGDKLYITSGITQLIEQNNLHITNLYDPTQALAIKQLCAEMANIIKTALFECKADILYSYITDHSLSGKYIPDIITFSGGVADCMRKNYSDFEFGDIGILLAQAVENSTKSYPCKIYNQNDNPIRATVIGAGNFSMEVSGSTICYDAIDLPLKNLPCITQLSEVKNEACAICIDSDTSPSFEYVKNLASNIFDAAQDLIKNNIPLVVITKNDFSKALGICLMQLLPAKYPLICADGIGCKKGDFVDIGYPLSEGKSVMIIVKTLVFGG